MSEVLRNLAKAKIVFQQRAVEAILRQQPIGKGQNRNCDTTTHPR